MTASTVLEHARVRAGLPPVLAESTVRGLAYDSRKVQPGYLFFAFPGAKADGRRFAISALHAGALAVVSESPRPDGFDGPWIEVEHGRRALASAAKTFFGCPDEKLALTGITGTNGKTTTSYLIDSVLRTAGAVTGIIGTIEYHLAGEIRPAVNTTPESLDVFAFCQELLLKSGTHLTMEVSSHALALGRAHGLRFHTAVFTNLSRDHLDFHKTMEAYFEAKRMLFVPEANPAPAAVINRDDEWGRRIDAPGRTLWYGLSSDAALRAEKIRSTFDGLHFELRTPEGAVDIVSPLVGLINVYNILAACGAGLSYGLPLDLIARGIANCASVPGRFEQIREGQPFLVVVDYAHTDDALRNVIAVARGLEPRRVVTLFGCGGDRDRSKRPLMAKAAAEASDLAVLTSDNPRSEDPLAIINDAMAGLAGFTTPHIVEPDRATAIRLALEHAEPGDIVLLAGKGHETYQVLKDRTIHFDDRELAREVLRQMGFRGKDGRVE